MELKWCQLDEITMFKIMAWHFEELLDNRCCISISPLCLSFSPPVWSESIFHRSDQSFIFRPPSASAYNTFAAVPTALMCADIVLWVILDLTYKSLRNYSIYLSQTKGRAGDRLQFEELTRGSMSLHGSYKRSAVVLLTRRQLESVYGVYAVLLMLYYSGGDVNSALARSLSHYLSFPHCLLHTHTHTHKCIRSPALRV